METRLKVSGGGELLRKSKRGGQTAVRTPNFFFLHEKHRVTNTSAKRESCELMKAGRKNANTCLSFSQPRENSRFAFAQFSCVLLTTSNGDKSATVLKYHC